MKQIISHEPNLGEVYKRNRRCILLDTSFILTCIKNKIDFFEHLKLDGFAILIPKQVMKELEGISKEKSEAKLALKLIEKNKPKIVESQGRNTDNAIINYAKKNPEIIVATLDKEIQSKIRNKKLIIKKNKRMEII